MGTFNEALRLLQARGEITLKRGPNGGVFASRPTTIQRLAGSVFAQHAEEPSLGEAFLIWSALDVLIARDVASHAGHADIAVLHDDVAAMRQSISLRDGTRFAKANWAFHAHLCHMCGIEMLKPIYMALLDFILSQTSEISSIDEALAQRIEDRASEHEAIVVALASGDPQRAELAMAAHNESAWINEHRRE